MDKPQVREMVRMRDKGNQTRLEKEARTNHISDDTAGETSVSVEARGEPEREGVGSIRSEKSRRSQFRN